MTSPLRTTVYLSGEAVKVLDRVKAEYARYGSATTVSAVFARLLLGESLDEVVMRPFRMDLARITGHRDKLRKDLERARARRRTSDLHRVHRKIAELFPALKLILHALGRVRRGKEPHSPDFIEAGRIEETLNDLLTECADAIVPRHPRRSR